MMGGAILSIVELITCTIPPFSVTLKAFDPYILKDTLGLTLLVGCVTRKYRDDTRAILTFSG